MKTDLKYRYKTEAIGGHVALDLLNTVSIVDGMRVDSLETDKDVKAWLLDNSKVLGIENVKMDFPDLAETTKRVREIIREIIAAKKQGKKLDIQPLNALLKNGVSYTQIVSQIPDEYEVRKIRVVDSVEQLVAAIADSAAELVAVEDASLIRKCESADCVLWFLDTTKGHKRRWCSMAICGNRHKVSKFRERQSHATH